MRIYGTGADKKELVEFGGVIQLEILKVGVYAIGILSPDPFSLVLVMGVRFPTAIELSFGFTFNGVGGILAINRRVDTGELIKGMQTHFIDRVLFPDDPVAEAPKILDQVAHVFPPHDGGFVVGPIVELGWGSQAKIVEAKLGVILALPDPKIIILGAGAGAGAVEGDAADRLPLRDLRRDHRRPAADHRDAPRLEDRRHRRLGRHGPADPVGRRRRLRAVGRRLPPAVHRGARAARRTCSG